MKNYVVWMLLFSLSSSVYADSLSQQVARALSEHPEKKQVVKKTTSPKRDEINLKTFVLDKPLTVRKAKNIAQKRDEINLKTFVLDKPLTIRKAKDIAQKLTVTESQLIALLLNDRQGKKTKSRLPDNFDWQAVARKIMGSEQPKQSYVTKIITRPYAYRNFKNAITKAKKMLNIKYLWGGTTPKGFDCSGLVQYTYRAAGIRLPRTAATQYRATKKVRHQRDARAGDLVFFHLPIARKVYINHVGIYLGGNRVLHAPGEGTRIAIDNLDTIRWSRFVVAYGRPMKKIRSRIVAASH